MEVQYKKGKVMTMKRITETIDAPVSLTNDNDREESLPVIHGQIMG
jgi:hypothetical protein